mgnify:FL=1
MPLSLSAKTIKVAVVDTGFDFNSNWSKVDLKFVGLSVPKLCPTGHKNYTSEENIDTHGHGTHIAGLIAAHADFADYCLVIYKYYEKDATGEQNLNRTINAFSDAVAEGVDIINYSGGGIIRSEAECSILKKALDKGIKVIAAAGNEGLNLNRFKFYPALCDPRITVVEAQDKAGKRLGISNYSSDSKNAVKTVKRLGLNVMSVLPNNQIGYMTGTSQSTAIVAGETVKRLYNIRNLDDLWLPNILKSANRMLASEVQCK